MKNRNIIPYLIIFIFLAILISGFIYLRAYTPKYQWSENLTKTNENPYGISILYNLTKESRPKEKFHEIKNDNFDFFLESKKNTSYVYIGSNYFIDSLNIQSILNYVWNGNKAFIATSRNIERFVYYWFKDSITGTYNYLEKDTIHTTLFLPDTLKASIYTFYYQFLKQTSNYPWHYFDTVFLQQFPDHSLKILSRIENGKPDFISIDLGDGTLYLHSNPIFLSNYHLIRKETFLYLQTVWNEVLSDEIFWDSFSSNMFNKTSFIHLKDSPLRFILKHKSLRWAWFILLISILLFVLIQSKRKQATIPLIAKKENNTLDYAKAIGALYFQAKGHRTITMEMMNPLYSFIKTRYQIKVGKEREKIVKNLSKLSGIKENTLTEIFKLELKLKFDDTAESSELYKLYNLVDQFYKKCN